MNSWTTESDESVHLTADVAEILLRRAIATDAGREKIITLEEIYQVDLNVT